MLSSRLPPLKHPTWMWTSYPAAAASSPSSLGSSWRAQQQQQQQRRQLPMAAPALAQGVRPSRVISVKQAAGSQQKRTAPRPANTAVAIRQQAVTGSDKMEAVLQR